MAPVVSASSPRLTAFKNGFLKRLGIVERPQRRFQALDHPARSLDGGRLLLAKTPLGDLLNQRMQRLDGVELL